MRHEHRRQPGAAAALLHAGRALLLLAFLALAAPAGAQDGNAQPAAASAQAPPVDAPAAPPIALLTIGPGPIYFERFGHNALVVGDPESPEALTYNYGMFDFEEANFLWNFVRGRMRYRLAVGRLADDLEMYRMEGRSAVLQRLALAPAEARELAAFLAWNAESANAFYRYDYFRDNCSTRVRDALDHALGGALRQLGESHSQGHSYRMDALRLMAPEPALMLLIDLGLGPFADRVIDDWQESFVPMTLRRLVREMRRADGRLLVAATEQLAENAVAVPPRLPPDLRRPMLAAGLGSGALLLVLAAMPWRLPRALFATLAGLFELACGLGGLALLFLWLGTEHEAAWRNLNLLLLNPLCLLLVSASWRRPAPALQRGLTWTVALGAGAALLVRLLPGLAQANLHWIALLAPIHLALALALARRGRKALRA